MIDTQLLNDALLTVALVVGVAILISVSIVAVAAFWQRHERKAHVREIEQHLAAVAPRESSSAAS